jgi:tRNA pseudouridine13 synthase
MLKEQFKEKNRSKRGLYISAVRSWFFNYVLSHRLSQNRWQQIMPGDVVMLEGTNSHFVADDLIQIHRRMLQGDLHLTGPMWGRGRSVTQSDALDWELGLLDPYREITQCLESIGLKQERRSIRIIPGDLQAQCNAPGTWKISFDLPPGSFATSVLRELCDYNNASAKT